MTMNVVFDFGAVLFAWQPHVLLGRHFPEHTATEAAARRLAADIFHHEDWQSFDRGTVDAPLVAERTAQRLSLPLQAMHGLVAKIPEYLAPLEDTVALLAGLQERRARKGDLQLYFLSNMPDPYARSLQQRYAFLECFAGGIFSCDVKMIKPETAIFQLLGERYALDPARTLFIDDMPANVQAARDFGWHAVHFQNAAQLAPILDSHLG